MLRPADVRTLATWVSPDYVLAAARSYSPDDVVLGGPKAYAEVRSLVLGYARYVRSRGGDPKDVTGAMRAWGHLVRYQPLEPFAMTPWRELACSTWNAPAPIPGWVEIEVGECDPIRLGVSVRRATCVMLRDCPHLNRAVLHGRVYQRTSAEILSPVSLGADELRTASADFSGDSAAEAVARWHRCLRAIVSAERHPLASVGRQILRSWLQEGFLASPGGAMVSHAAVPQGWAALVPPNGIPLAISIGRVERGRFRLCLTLDHRAFDGEAAAEAYDYLADRVPELLCESSSSEGRRGSARRSSLT